MNDTLPIAEMQKEEQLIQERSTELFFKKYKRHISIVIAIVVVGVSAFSHYKNDRLKEELIGSISEYQKSLMLIGGEMKYRTIECGGIISTECDIEDISLSMLGEEQFSVKSFHIGDVEDLRELSRYGEGKSVDASIDIELKQVTLPLPLIAQIVGQNIGNAFQESALERLKTMDFALEGEIEGSSAFIKHIEIDRFRIDNSIMPLEFSMKAREISSEKPDSMILERFALNAQDRAISDVTYESVKRFLDTLHPNEKGLFLKEFSLLPADMKNKEKASSAINKAIAKRFENDLKQTQGSIEKELIRAMMKILEGSAKEATLAGENQNDLTIAQVQRALAQSSAMNEEEARMFMDNKFKLEVQVD